MSSSTPQEQPDPVAALQALLVGADTLAEFLDALTGLTVAQLPEGSRCGVTVRNRGGRPATLAASDALTGEVDQVQYTHGAGPCLATLDTGQIHYVPDTGTETRWAPFCRDALARGVRSCLSLPLLGPGGVLGGFNLYSTRRDGFPDDSWAQVQLFAGNAAGALAVALKLAERAELSADLRRAMESRSIIDQATGILMVRQRCDASTAFDLLRQASQHRNIKLREIAAELVAGVAGHPPEPSGFQPRRS